MHHDQVRFIPRVKETFNIEKSINVIYHTKRIKDKTHTIILMNSKKIF